MREILYTKTQQQVTATATVIALKNAGAQTPDCKRRSAIRESLNPDVSSPAVAVAAAAAILKAKRPPNVSPSSINTQSETPAHPLDVSPPAAASAKSKRNARPPNVSPPAAASAILKANRPPDANATSVRIANATTTSSTQHNSYCSSTPRIAPATARLQNESTSAPALQSESAPAAAKSLPVLFPPLAAAASAVATASSSLILPAAAATACLQNESVPAPAPASTAHL